MWTTRHLQGNSIEVVTDGYHGIDADPPTAMFTLQIPEKSDEYTNVRLFLNDVKLFLESQEKYGVFERLFKMEESIYLEYKSRTFLSS